WAYWIGPIAAALVIGFITRNAAQSTQKDESNDADNQPESKPAQAQSQPKAEPSTKPTESTEQHNESEIEQSQEQSDLQSKAQASISQLKDSAKRPKLPFSQSKPSFYPLASNIKEEPKATTSEASSSGLPAAEAK